MYLIQSIITNIKFIAAWKFVPTTWWSDGPQMTELGFRGQGLKAANEDFFFVFVCVYIHMNFAGWCTQEKSSRGRGIKLLLNTNLRIHITKTVCQWISICMYLYTWIVLSGVGRRVQGCRGYAANINVDIHICIYDNECSFKSTLICVFIGTYAWIL